jgi:hypothetical protein
VYAGLAWLLGLFLGPQMGGWGNLYVSGVLLIGTAYVLLNRRSDAATALASVCLAAALIAGLYWPGRRAGWYGVAGPGAALALGLAWCLSRRAAPDAEAAAAPEGGDDRLERLGLYLGLLTGLGLSVRNGLKGWCNLYLGDEDYWGARLWESLGPAYLACLAAIGLWLLSGPRRARPGGARFPHAFGWMWLVLIVQNLIAQLVTGPHRVWSETAFSLYYLLLFVISAVIVFHYQAMRRRPFDGRPGAVDRPGVGAANGA